MTDPYTDLNQISGSRGSLCNWIEPYTDLGTQEKRIPYWGIRHLL